MPITKIDQATIDVISKLAKDYSFKHDWWKYKNLKSTMAVMLTRRGYSDCAVERVENYARHMRMPPNERKVSEFVDWKKKPRKIYMEQNEGWWSFTYEQWKEWVKTEVVPNLLDGDGWELPTNREVKCKPHCAWRHDKWSRWDSDDPEKWVINALDWNIKDWHYHIISNDLDPEEFGLNVDENSYEVVHESYAARL